MEFIAMFSDMARGISREWKARPLTLNFLGDFFNDLKHYSVLSWNDIAVVAAVALVMTLLRFVLTKFVFQPLATQFCFIKSDKQKFSESSWKLIFYVVAMVWEFYLVISTYPSFFTDPASCWRGWYLGMPVQNDLYYLYMYECGFYLHAVFGTIYMDVWRRDSIAMIAHHILTDSLILFSIAIRYHRIGLVVLVLHDAADVFLEATKLLTCFKNRSKNPGMLLEGCIAGGFITFALTWLVFRLYAYPKFVLLPCTLVARETVPHGPFYFFFNGMLMMLFGLNVYWFHFIALLIFRIATGQSRGVEDTREDEDDCVMNGKNDSTKSNGVHHQNGNKTHQNGSSTLNNTNGHIISNHENGYGAKHRATNNNGIKH